ncbi:MAG: hypothetical protein ACRDSI_00775 [Pseudonocardiaceae bacterium]
MFATSGRPHPHSGNRSAHYRVYPAADTVEITLGGPNGLDLQMSEAGLRHCVTTFTNALTAFDAANGRLPHSAG